MSQSVDDLFSLRRITTLLGTFFAIYISLRLFRLVQVTYRARQRYQDIPQLPRHPIWGHLVNMGEKLNPVLKRSPDYAFEEVWHALGDPAAYLMDLHPVDGAFLVVVDPALAEEVCQPSTTFKYSLPKSDTLMAMYRLIGVESLIITEGEEWKTLRRRFNKGFAPQHLHTLDALIIDKTRVFVERLKQLANTQETFLLKDYAQDLTTDIITTVAIEKDYHAQTLLEGVGSKGTFGVLTAARLLSQLVYPIGRGFNPFIFLDPIRPAKSWFYEQIYNRELAARVRQQIASEREQINKNLAESEKTTTQRSITRLALSGLDPNEALVRSTVAQIKSFLFAGQDTTATLIQWMCFELSKASWSPTAATMLKRLTAEHDSVFGTKDDPFNAFELLGRTDEEGRKETEAILGSRLPYTTAFIKETLRIHPPAATARVVPEISAKYPTPVYMKIRNSSGEAVSAQVNGLRVYTAQYLIHTDKTIWGPDALTFRPDRWLDDEYMSKIPTGAWRPFERGPRNCIGQELAWVEAKVVLCAVSRGFEWEKVGYSGRSQTDAMAIPRGDGKDDPERDCWSINQVTSVPVDGMKMRIKLRE